MPILPGRRADELLTFLGLVFTVLCTALFCVQMSQGLLQSGPLIAVLEQLVLSFIILGFVYGSLVYHLTRMGYLKRVRDVTTGPLSAAELPLITLLLPSFKEEARSIGQALLSSGLLDYPRKRVVLLIDDAPDPATTADARLLQAGRSLVRQFEEQFAELRQSLSGFQDQLISQPHIALARAYRTASAKVYQLSDTYDSQADHTDRCFFETVILPVADSFSRRAAILESLPELSSTEAAQELAALVSRFNVDFSSFERKQYANLSHEPNKAMNINSYLGLMGRSLREDDSSGERLLIDADNAIATITILESPYVITLDADSFLTQSYARTLVGFLERPGNERIAVAQTPYSAIPGSPIAIERAAGATTDMQYISHQGFTAHCATYWVGANAVLRKAALDEIVELDFERGYPIKRFIQDRTVIEDTESSIDLIARGWSLYNHPERLSYSATPADAGSLLIQRRRWSNGGLLIFPKMVRYYFSELRKGRVRVLESLLRAHYLVSPTLANLGLLTLFLFPLGDGQVYPTIVLASLPYFYFYSSDLRRSGYKRLHVFNVYALNLLLVPINIGGILKSIHQGLSSTRVPFGRTPKVGSRTAMPAFYVMLEVALLIALAHSAVSDFVQGRSIHFAFSMFNLTLLWYGFVVFLGIPQMWTDLRAPVRRPAWLKGRLSLEATGSGDVVGRKVAIQEEL